MLVLYGSQTGTAEEVAERIAREAWRRGGQPRTCAMNDYPFAQLINERFVACVCSTTGVMWRGDDECD